MPSKSKAQHNLMEAVAHSEKFAKKVGIPMSVGKDFAEADKGKKFRKGGSVNPTEQAINKQQTHHGSMALPNVSLNKFSTNRFGVGGDVNYTYGGKGQINKQRTRGGSIDGYQKNVPNISLNKYIGKKEGGMATSKLKGLFKGKESYSEELKEAKAIKSGKITPQEYAKGEKMEGHKKGGVMKETMGPRTMSKDVEAGSNKLTKFGESAVQKRGKTKGTNLGDSGPSRGIMGMCGGGKAKKMAKGGTASSRGDGIASKGKTKGKMC
jgi:hypothetical protein